MHHLAAHQVQHGHDQHEPRRVKVFAYEHITGGGNLPERPSAALAREALLIWKAMLDDLVRLPGMSLVTLALPKYARHLPAGVDSHAVHQAGDWAQAFDAALSASEWVWIVAPETDDTLARLAQCATTAGRQDLGASAEAIRLCSSKTKCAAALAANGIAVAPHAGEGGASHWVVKPDDGCGSDGVRVFDDLAAARAWQEQQLRPQVLQVFVSGPALSLSVIATTAATEVLSVNEQQVAIEGGAMRLTGLRVNARPVEARHAKLAQAVAGAIAGLRGYFGVDFIDTGSGACVLEVNPRLTTSYAAIRTATGINPAARLLGLDCPQTAAAGAVELVLCA
jgi:predicted ATP-grasp superfamily ATP-dependent carboligase